MHPDIVEILLPADHIQARIREIGLQITSDYRGKDVLLIGVLKGMTLFMADLIRCIDLPLSVDYMAISRYGPGSQALGVVRIIKDLDSGIEGKHVLFIEDIVDTGLTLGYILRNLRYRSPASLEVCVLFNKAQRRLVDIPIKYKGFDLPDKFVVGYGLDYAQMFRNLPYVGVLKADVYLGLVKK
ncbi:MAG: hypoxanthine phosphoribosyltransferase [Chloroflexi bacterium]|nr:hypoxanthine phosphoribosyltransferase [Chloroflexota bacterium]